MRAVVEFLDKTRTRCKVLAVGEDIEKIYPHVCDGMYGDADIPEAHFERWRACPSLTFAFDGETVVPYHDLGED